MKKIIALLQYYAASFLIVMAVFSLANYLSAPEGAPFELKQLNPMEFIEGLRFAIGYGLGLSDSASLAVIFLLIVLFLIGAKAFLSFMINRRR